MRALKALATLALAAGVALGVSPEIPDRVLPVADRLELEVTPLSPVSRPPAPEPMAATAEGSVVWEPPAPEPQAVYGWDSPTGGYGVPGDPCTPDPVTGMEDNDACLIANGYEPPYE